MEIMELIYLSLLLRGFPVGVKRVPVEEDPEEALVTTVEMIKQEEGSQCCKSMTCTNDIKLDWSIRARHLAR